jgi:hypothetical protein
LALRRPVFVYCNSCRLPPNDKLFECHQIIDTQKVGGKSLTVVGILKKRATVTVEKDGPKIPHSYSKEEQDRKYIRSLPAILLSTTTPTTKQNVDLHEHCMLSWVQNTSNILLKSHRHMHACSECYFEIDVFLGKE